MKKRIVRITAALCAAALLAGCGSSIGGKDCCRKIQTM